MLLRQFTRLRKFRKTFEHAGQPGTVPPILQLTQTPIWRTQRHSCSLQCGWKEKINVSEWNWKLFWNRDNVKDRTPSLISSTRRNKQWGVEAIDFILLLSAWAKMLLRCSDGREVYRSFTIIPVCNNSALSDSIFLFLKEEWEHSTNWLKLCEKIK